MSRFVLYYMGHPNVPNSYPNYAVGFEVWASVSLAIDTTIAGIMIWSVRDQPSHPPPSFLYIRSQLKKKEILSKRLMSKIAHLVYLIIGTGVLTGTPTLFEKVLSYLSGYTSYNKPCHCHFICRGISYRLGTSNCSI